MSHVMFRPTSMPFVCGRASETWIHWKYPLRKPRTIFAKSLQASDGSISFAACDFPVAICRTPPTHSFTLTRPPARPPALPAAHPPTPPTHPTHPPTQTRTGTGTHTHAHAHAHARTRTYTHAHNQNKHIHTHTHLGIHLAATHLLVIKHCLVYLESMKLSGIPKPVWPQGSSVMFCVCLCWTWQR